MRRRGERDAHKVRGLSSEQRREGGILCGERIGPVLSEADETVERINRYKAAGASVISITNTAQCPAAQMSDINFACYMPEICGELDHISRISQIPAVYILERLAAAIQSSKTEK